MIRFADSALKDYFSNRLDHKDLHVSARMLSKEIQAANAGIQHGFDTILQVNEEESPLMKRKKELEKELKELNEKLKDQ